MEHLPPNPEVLCQPFDPNGQTFLKLAQIITKVQNHVCDSVYCQRKNRRTNETSCRFYFPRNYRNSAEFTTQMNPNVWTFAAQRNDQNLNPYNRAISLIWMANTDISVCGDSNAVINYIAKYCSKAEKQSSSFRQIIQSILPSLNAQHPRLSLVQKIMNRLVAERDISGQELQHYIQKIPLYHASRDMIYIDCRPPHIQDHQYFAQGGNIQAGKTTLQKYMARDIEIVGHISFFEWIRKWDFRLLRKRPRAPLRIPVYSPIYKGNIDSPDFEHFCRVKVCIFYLILFLFLSFFLIFFSFSSFYFILFLLYFLFSFPFFYIF